MRFSVIAACLSVCLIGFSLAQEAHASIRKATNIPAEGLGPALNALAKDRDFQIVYVTEEIANVRTEGAVGELTTEEALKRLLNGTGLTFRYLDSNTVTIGSATTPRDRAARASSSTSSGTLDDTNAGQEGKKSSSQDFRLAQVDQATVRPSTVVNVSQTGRPELTEILVTAQKREERLQDVPVPVTVVSGETLIDNNQLRVQDYYTSIPGLNVTPAGSGSFQSLSIRGISTGIVANPTVGIMVDDVPFGSSTSVGGGGAGQILPDIDPSDLARVEVLRGPQGTLYGADSMGGLFKFVTADPSVHALTGRIEADTNSVYNGAELGYGVRGAVNVPLDGTLAIRASGFARQDPGYIDNVQSSQRGINEAKAYGGHVSLLWVPSDSLSLKASALIQEIKGDGASDVDVLPGLGDRQQSHPPGTGAYDRKVQAYSAALTAKLGAAELTAVSGYNVMAFADSFDITYALGQLSQNLFGVTGTFSPEKDSTDKFTQELRLSVPIGHAFNWLVGGFYTHEDSKFYQGIFAANPTGAVVAEGFTMDSGFSSTYTEIAGFTDLTAHVTDQFDIQLGGRESHIRQDLSQQFYGPLVEIFYLTPSPLIYPEAGTTANAFTYLVTPEFRLSPDVMLYARLASGYRAGGINYSAGPGSPLQYNPDKTRNYELGIKGSTLDQRLSFDVSLYYIDWKDIQLFELNPITSIGYSANGGRAKSEGAEISIEAKPFNATHVAMWMAWNKAVLVDDLPSTSSVYGASGERLPYSSPFSGNLSLQQDFPVTDAIGGYVGTTVSYVGNREGELAPAFDATTQRTILPSYTKVDLRTGAKFDSWTVNLFLNNVTDRRGALYGGIGANPPFGYIYIQPRTVGLSVVKTF